MDAFWPIVILWVVLTVLGSRKKKPRSQAPVPPRPRTEPATGRGQGGFLEEMKRALEEMQRAAEEEERRRRAAAGGVAAEEATAEAWLETRREETRATLPPTARQRSQAPARRKPVQRPQRPLEDDDFDKSSEDPTVTSLEGADYDAEAEAIVRERAKAADRGVREETGASAMSSAQLARRGSRQVVALGGGAQHDAWHKAIAATPAPAVATETRKRNPLARWADGSMRSAFVLAEILGRPPGAR